MKTFLSVIFNWLSKLGKKQPILENKPKEEVVPKVPDEKPKDEKPTGKVKHENNGKCLKCDEIFNEYPAFNLELREWFEEFQSRHAQFHISCAGRGREEQEKHFRNGKSRAYYGQSAHNYNAALDIWVNENGKYTLPKELYNKVLRPNLKPWIKWYGEPGSSFYELPHCEVKNWKEMREEGTLSLVE